MVTTIFIAVLFVGLLCLMFGAEAEFAPAYLIGFVLGVYSVMGLMLHHAPNHEPKDFTSKELTQDAYDRSCMEVVLRADYTPVCVNKYREDKQFTTKVDSLTLWPLGRWSKKHTVNKYRTVTRNDLDTACDNVVSYSVCQQSGTFVVVKMKMKE